MMNIGPMTEVSLLLGTIICLGSFFLIDNNIPLQAIHKEEQLLEDYYDLADFANAVRNGDKDLEEAQIQSTEAADIYNHTDDNMKDCIEPATEIGHSLSNQEVIHCFDDVNYFQNKYSSISTNSTVRANTTFATSTAVPDTDSDTAINTTSSSSDTSSSDTSSSDTSSSDTSSSDTSSSDTSSSDTSSSDTSITDIPSSDTSITDIPSSDTSITDIPTSDDTSSDTSTNTQAPSANDTQAPSANDTQAPSANDTQATSANDTQATSAIGTTSSNNEENQVDSSDSNTNGNPEDYDSLSDLVKDIKDGVVDVNEISLNNFQNSGAYKEADEQTQDCIDLAGKIGNNLIDYEIVLCSEDPNHFKNQIENDDNNNEENNDNNNPDSDE
jgi:hypothetical protein